jgi:phosphatidylinositol alpha-mannosyltransferase
MRIALTHVHCWPEVRRGGERYLHEVAAALARSGHAVEIISTTTGAPGRAEEDGVVVRRYRGRAPSLDRAPDAAFGRTVLRPLLAGRFDVVHSLGPADAAASTLVSRIRRRRTVFTNLGNPVRSWWDAQRDARAHQRVVEHVEAYGCLSQYGLRRLREDWGRTGVLTPGGVSLEQFRPAERRSLRPTILFSGALTDPRKGVSTLLAAVGLLASRGVDVRLLLSGSGDPSELLASAPPAARAVTEVLPLGSPGDQPRRYGEAWVTALPSTGEAFGLALLESLACGTPIVGADDASLPELVTPGVGALAAPGDVESLAVACERALALAAEAGAVDRCRDAARAYDWTTAIVPRLEAIYAGT